MLIHKIESRLLEEEYVKKYLKMLQNTLDRIDKELMQIFVRVNKDGKWSNAELAKYNRKMKLREQIRQEVKKYKKQFLAIIRDDLAELYRNESLYTRDILKRNIKTSYTFDRLPTQAIKSQVVDTIEIKGKTLAEYIEKYSTDLVFRVEQEIFDSIVLGENPRETARRLNDIYNTMARHRVEMTTRTWQLAIYNRSNIDVYEQAGIKKVRYLATLDSRTCPVCAKDHNKVMKLGEEIFLPRHVYCRCAYAPFIDSKTTEPATGYEEWLKDGRRSKEQLDKVQKDVERYMDKGLISEKEGKHLLKIINQARKDTD